MARAFAVETIVQRPAGPVWDALTDWESAHRWMRGVGSMSVEGGTVAGSAITFRARGKERPAEIVAVEPGTLVTVRSTQGPVSADYTYRLHDLAGERTRVTLEAECRVTGVASAAAPLFRFLMRRTDSGQLEALRALIEGETAPPAPG